MSKTFVVRVWVDLKVFGCQTAEEAKKVAYGHPIEVIDNEKAVYYDSQVADVWEKDEQ
jgi:hypothetical protein